MFPSTGNGYVGKSVFALDKHKYSFHETSFKRELAPLYVGDTRDLKNAIGDES